MSHLHTVAKTLVSSEKGILAADERTTSITKRFDAIGVPSTDETRRAYREMLLTSPGIEQHIAGVIMFDETFRQASTDGIPFPRLLEERGIMAGIKLDEGTADVDGHPGEKITTGLANLPLRLPEYVALGASFAKWRAVYAITDALPSADVIAQNASDLAAYAKACQEAVN